MAMNESLPEPASDGVASPTTSGSEPSGKRGRDQRRRAKREALIEPCEPVCVECDKLAALVKGDRIYPHRTDLHAKNFFLCECGAYVGCHPFTRIALGRPAGPMTRRARNSAHNAFDILWRRKMRLTGCSQGEARNAAYRWLAEQLGYEQGKCHVAWMTAPEARAVVRLCDPFVHGRAAADTSDGKEIPG
jgi:hypothetical protein